MKDLSRQGIYRIAYDIVKADRLITMSEMNMLKQICDTYAITSDMREAAMCLSLSEAVREVRTMPVRQMERLIDDLKQLTLADGNCCREEALLLNALCGCFDKNATDEHSDIISVPWGDIMLDNNQVLFVENCFDTDVNAYICEHYSHLCNSFKVAGFDFVYLPKAMEVLSSTNSDLLDNVVYYLASLRTEEEATLVAQEMKDMTTVKLYRELLLGKLHFPLDITAPSIIIRIGFSIVNGCRMANYLVMKLTDDIARQTDNFVSGILALQSDSTIVLDNAHIKSQAFVYAGFYRTLFDLVTYRRGVQQSLVVHPYDHKNVLSVRSVNADMQMEEPLVLGPKESAFYVFLIRETQEHGGFNIASDTPESIRYMDEAQKRFEKTYFSLCNRDTAPDVTNPDIRRPMLSKIRKAIDICDILVQKMMFLPDTDKNKVVRVHVEREQIVEG